jgi:hypothetical protein
MAERSKSVRVHIPLVLFHGSKWHCGMQRRIKVVPYGRQRSSEIHERALNILQYQSIIAFAFKKKKPKKREFFRYRESLVHISFYGHFEDRTGATYNPALVGG